MSGNKNAYKITMPAIIWKLALLIFAFFAGVNVVVTIAQPDEVHVPMYVCTAVFAMAPALLVSLWALLFEITVDGDVVTVRRRFGLSRMAFAFDEIDRVTWSAPSIDDIELANIRIYVHGKGSVPIESTMVNGRELSGQIATTLPKDKFSYR